jgi:hypothetical protein
MDMRVTAEHQPAERLDGERSAARQPGVTAQSSVPCRDAGLSAAGGAEVLGAGAFASAAVRRRNTNHPAVH